MSLKVSTNRYRLNARRFRSQIFTLMLASVMLLGRGNDAWAHFEETYSSYIRGDRAVLQAELKRFIDERRDAETLRWFGQLYGGSGQGRMLNFAPSDQALVVEAVRGAVERTLDPQAMYRISLLYQMLGNKSEERLWLSRAAAVGYVDRPSNGDKPVYAKYLLGQMLGLAGEFEAAFKEMEAALAAGDSEAEIWLISQYARGTPLENSFFARRRLLVGPPGNPSRAADLLVNRANRVLADSAQHFDIKARALEALGMVKVWNPSSPSDLTQAITLFERAWELDKSGRVPREMVKLLQRGVGDYSDADRQALIREWQDRQIRIDNRPFWVH